jgi:type I restriction enzyme R subunit
MPQTPEDRARQEIDRQLDQAGWTVQDYRRMNLSAGNIAVREFPLSTGHADYLLYADGRAIGVVEAKPEGHPLTGIETQSAKYLDGLPPSLPNYLLPLPFAYESTGSETRFSNCLEPDARSRPVFTFHRPEELVRLVNLDDQVRALLRKLPPLDTGKLWRIQIEAIENLELPATTGSISAVRPPTPIFRADASSCLRTKSPDQTLRLGSTMAAVRKHDD